MNSSSADWQNCKKSTKRQLNLCQTCVIPAYVLFRPALIPCGGSLVNLMEDWRRVIGNLGWTSVVIHKRNFSFTFSVLVIWKPKIINSLISQICHNTKPRNFMREENRQSGKVVLRKTKFIAATGITLQNSLTFPFLFPDKNMISLTLTT